MPRIKRITRKELRKNELVEAIQTTIHYIKENPKKLKMGGAIAGGVLFVLLVANFLIKKAINTPKEEFAQTIFSYHYSNDEAKFSSGKAQFQQFFSKHKKGDFSSLALLYKGASEKGLNDYAQATETFSLLLKNKNNIVSSPALMNLANIEEENGDYKKAQEFYKMLEAKGDYLKKYAKERISYLNKTKVEIPSTKIGTLSTNQQGF